MRFPALHSSCRKTRHQKTCFQRDVWGGVSLLEVMFAMLILAMAVFPLIRSFTQNHALAVRQINQEVALKIAEAALNSAMSGHFEILDAGSAAAGASLPLRLELPNQPSLSGAIVLASLGPGKTSGGTSFRVGATTFNVTIDCDPLYGVPPGIPPLKLTYRNADEVNVPYDCPPDERLLLIKSSVSWDANGVPQNITLESCRAKMSK